MDNEIEKFINFMNIERAVAKNTILAYKNDLIQLSKFLNNQGLKAWDNVSVDDIKKFSIEIPFVLNPLYILYTNPIWALNLLYVQ